MPAFSYVAINSQGKEARGEIEAGSRAEALTKIRGQGLFPTSIAERRAAARAAAAPTPAAAAGGRSFLGGGRVKRKQLTVFTRQLSTLQDAGLPIVRSVKILEGQLKPCALKRILVEVAEAVESGSSFSEALSQHPRAFDRLFVNMIRAGEIGGVLDTVLRRLAEFMEKSDRLIRRVKGAMVYPVAVISIAILIVTALMIFVIPKFEDLFAKMNAELPTPTMILLTLSRNAVPLAGLLALVVGGLFFVSKAMQRSQQGRLVLDNLKLSMPVLGTVLNKSVIARFTRTLGTLIASGVPILEALNIVRETTGNEVIAQALGKIHDSIREGESIAGPLRETKVCDAMVVNMVDVGEETGDLDKMLIKIADTYDEEVDTAVDGMVSLFEPVLIVLMGVIIGGIVISLFLPLISMMQNLDSASTKNSPGGG